MFIRRTQASATPVRTLDQPTQTRVATDRGSLDALFDYFMIREDQYAGLCMEVKSLQRQLTEAEKRATERWYMYDAERQNHNITKKDLRMAIDALEYYLDNGDCHNAITRAEEAIKAIVLSQSTLEQAGLSEPLDILSNVEGHGLSPVAKDSTTNPASHG